MTKKLTKTIERLILVAIFLIPFYFIRFSILGIPTNIFEIAVFVSLLAACYLLFTTQAKLKFGPVWPYLFLIAAFVSVFFADDRISAWGVFKGWFLVPVVFYWLILNYPSFVIPAKAGIYARHKDRFQLSSLQAGMTPQKEFKQFLSNLFFPLILSSTLVSLWAILQRLGLVGLAFYQKADPTSFLSYLDQGRAFGPFESPNYLAMFLTPVFFLLLGLIKTGQKHWLIWIAAALNILAIFLSKSAGGYLSLILSLLWLGFYYLNDQKKFNYWRTVGSVVLPVLSIIVIYQAYIKLLNDDLRLQIYHYAINLLRSYYAWGLGLGGFYHRLDALVPSPSVFREFVLPYALHPHNLYLALWLNLGLAGLIVFVLLVGDFFRRLSAANSLFKYSAALAMAAILIHGLVDTTYFKNDLAALFWLIMAVPYLRQSKDEKLSD